MNQYCHKGRACGKSCLDGTPPFSRRAKAMSLAVPPPYARLPVEIACLGPAALGYAVPADLGSSSHSKDGIAIPTSRTRIEKFFNLDCWATQFCGFCHCTDSQEVSANLPLVERCSIACFDAPALFPLDVVPLFLILTRISTGNQAHLFVRNECEWRMIAVKS